MELWITCPVFGAEIVRKFGDDMDVGVSQGESSYQTSTGLIPGTFQMSTHVYHDDRSHSIIVSFKKFYCFEC